MLAVVLIYVSLFLGEVRGCYVRFWWWDVFLHTGSGFLLGITGFLLVHALNEYEEVELNMKPGFVALFAFMFAMSSVSNGMNEVMKVLTIIATIFIPLSFFAGLYAMNLEYMPELAFRWAYPALLAVMFVIGAGMLWAFRRKGWL